MLFETAADRITDPTDSMAEQLHQEFQTIQRRLLDDPKTGLLTLIRTITEYHQKTRTQQLLQGGKR